MNKQIYWGPSVLKISKTVMFAGLYNYVKPIYWVKANLYYMDMDSLIVNIKTEDIYKEILNDVKKRFDVTNYDWQTIVNRKKIC